MRNIILKIVTIFFLPGIVFASQDGGHYGISSLTWYYVNSFIFFATLFFIIKKPMKKTFKERKNNFSNSIEEASKVFNDAESALIKVQKRNESLDSELKKIKDAIILEANEQANNIIDVANKKVTYLKDSAKQMIVAEEQKALNNLSKQFGEMLINSVTQDIKKSLSDDLDKKLIYRGIDDVKKVVN